MIARRDASHAQHLELRVKIKEIEDSTTMQRQRVRKVEHEASNSRSDMALLAAYQHQIRTLKRGISGAEEEGLALLERADGAQADLERLKSEVDAAEQGFAELSRNVETEMATAAARLETLEAQRRKRMSSEIPPEGLQLYERLLSAREGVALAELDGRICQACFMEVPTNLYVRVARGTQLTQCPSCDRILFQRG